MKNIAILCFIVFIGWIFLGAFAHPKEQKALKAKLMGKFDPAQDTTFILIDTLYTHKEKIYLQKKAYAAFKEMYESALKDSIELKILSATRPFLHQKMIWEDKWDKMKQANANKKHITDKNIAAEILRYSAMPGTSRHHWGTDIDLVSLESSFFRSEKGKKIYEWLQTNAPKFGFCQPYKDKALGRTGYEDEPWHWSYKEIASEMQNLYQAHITYDDIKDFKGYKTARELQVIERYVLGIHSDCIQ